ncbi:MAG: hypothetical protein ACLPKI_21855 [Streptosporangiaceae bacterium]
MHRNFTTDQLVAALFCGWYARRRAFAERALADPDPWHGLVSFLEDVLDGMKAEHTERLPGLPPTAEQLDRAQPVELRHAERPRHEGGAQLAVAGGAARGRLSGGAVARSRAGLTEQLAELPNLLG